MTPRKKDKTKTKIIVTEEGNRIRAVYAPSVDEWLLTFEPESTGKRGRPRQNTTYTTAAMFFSLRQRGIKYEAALAEVAERRDISTREVLRHWNLHKEKLNFYKKRKIEMLEKIKA